MKKYLIILFLLASCKEKGVEIPVGFQCSNHVSSWSELKCKSEEYLFKSITTCDNQKRADFIINCAKAANPMSDEEGEDLVKECNKVSYQLFCETTIEPYKNEKIITK